MAIRSWLLWSLSCVLLVGLTVAFVDRPAATWSHDVLHRPAAAVFVTTLAKWWVFCAGALAVQAACLLWRLSGRHMEPAWRTALAASLAVLIAIVAEIVLKYAFGRLWPETWLHPPNPSWIGTHSFAFQPFHGGTGYESFPSGHTARATAPFAVLWQRLPRGRAIWALPPLIMAAALIASNFHFVGDCLAGAYVGFGSAALAMMLF